MSSSRYERVAQQDDSISLNTVSGDSGIPILTPADSSYNYNSGVPTSPPPSFRSRTSSIAFPPITTTAPPTFPSDFSTVQLTPGSSERTITGGNSDGGDESSEALIRAMSKRIERLEESIGLLLMERETQGGDSDQRPRHRCCLSFTQSENPGDVENRLGSGDCCITVHPRRSSGERITFGIIKSLFMALAMLFIWTIVMAAINRKGKGH